MTCMCIDTALSIVFQKLGYIVGKYPGYFVLVPFFIACILATGLQRLRYEDDPEYLFSPTDGRSKLERAIIDEYFPINYTQNFNLGRITHKGRFGRLIITARDGGSVLRRSVWNELMQLDSAIKNLTIEWDDKIYRYQDMCAKHEFKCFNNDILDFDNKIDDIEANRYFLKYPIWVNHETYKAYFFPAYLGGVQRDANNIIESAKGVNLMYFADTTIKNGDIRGQLWEQRFLDFAASVQFENIIVSRFISTTLQKELDSNTHSLVPFFSITIAIMLVFSIGTCMMFDWVRSKPWLGLMGCLSAGIAVIGAFGLCVYCGIEMIGINLAAPFLMLGVGMDDAFVLLAAWRRTNPTMSVPKRLSHTYAEAAVSITITSLTNFISFMIGIITPFPSVRIFCIYTSVAVLFTYAYHITFFGGLMAYFGEVERRNLHGLICIPVLPKSLAEDKGFFFRLLCTGGRNPNDPDNPKDNKEHMMMIFFRDVLAESLNRPLVKLLVISVFLIYLFIGIYGCSVIKEGLDRRKLSRDDSYSIQFYDFEDKYFREYPYRIQVVVNETMNYADPKIQQQIEDMLRKFEESPYVADKSMTESWLRSYLTFLGQDDSFLFLQALNVSDPLDFYRGLRDIFLHFPLTEQFRFDVVFNEDGSEVIASRYIIQAKNILDANMEKEMLISLRGIADSFPFHVTIYHHYFIFFDQFVLVRSISIQTITVAAIVMMAISLIFIPSPSCAIWVAFSIISIEIGVIGYMTLWNVNLDSISMINLIMCIGFSVDFSAHISYAYISCNERTPGERVKSALYSLGLPIFQGSVSTVLGIIALAFAPSYVFVTFFKTVFLVMLFGATHEGQSSDNKSLHLSSKLPQPYHFKTTNLQTMQKELPFFTAEKFFDGKTIVHKNGGPIYIPRPSYINLACNISVEGSKSLSVSDSSVVAEKDLGLGTSAEECSESSWKAAESKIDHHVDMIVKKQPQRIIENHHVNDGYLSDSLEQSTDASKMFVTRSKSNDTEMVEPRRNFKNNRQSRIGPTNGHEERMNRNILPPSLFNHQQQNNHHNLNRFIPMSYNRYLEEYPSTRQRLQSYRIGSLKPNRTTHRIQQDPDIILNRNEMNTSSYHYFDYNLHWDSRWSGTVPANQNKTDNSNFQ
ncbi:patched domain-containing protein 3-like [Dermatophagoides farinae]|uniref:Patched domain-containing protein 3-like n=1 Tax=Dermatophagoides farinae TaxID=6954 RepID=A0A9D4P6D9_DERFA|nr:patched domain-containing protein 3-like [Dermatophagoides farinae]